MPPTVPTPAISTPQTQIHDLPTDVLVTILSLLDDSTEAVRTCVLSKRWRNLWTFVPRLELQYDDPGYESASRKHLFKSLLNFANRFLLLRNNTTDLHFFKLELMVLEELVPARDLPTLAQKINSWIVYALKHNPRSIDIECYLINYDFNLPDHLFTSETLEDVCLAPLSELNIPDSVFLPNLQRIHLRFQYEHTEINGLDKLAFGCPNLENLTLIGGRFEMKKDVSFPNLKKLCMCECEFYTQALEEGYYISAPCLEYLLVDGYRRQYGNKFKDLYKVKKAKIEVHDIEGNNCELLTSLLHVETLQLYGPNLKGLLEKELRKCPVFYNLKKLTLGGNYCVRCNSAILCIFLKQCPNLEVLKICHNSYSCLELCKDDSREFESFSCNQLRLINVFLAPNICVDDDNHDTDQLETYFCKMGLKNIQINYILPDGN